MNKILMAGIGGVIVIGLFILAYQLTSPSRPAPENTSPTTPGVGLPTASSVAQPVSSTSSPATMSVAGSDGSVIQTNNFLADPTTTRYPLDSDFYYLNGSAAGGASGAATPAAPFSIGYIRSTQYFNVTLLQEPIGPVRTEMEQYLMGKLGLTQSQMCQLNYSVGVPNFVNTQFSGMNLGFSFCPGATKLPQ